MDYSSFIKAVALARNAHSVRRKPLRKPKCQRYTDFSYSALRQRGAAYWLHLDRMDEVTLGQEIVDCFLNTSKWSCHLPRPDTPKGRKMLCNLQWALSRLPPYYHAVAHMRVTNIGFGGLASLQNVMTPTTDIIDSIYSMFRQVGQQFSRVASSKLMHMALPELFMMWDKDIIHAYDVPRQDLDPLTRRVRSYTAFMVLMQENTRHLKETHPSGSGIADVQLAHGINVQCGCTGLPMTRLLDLANFAVARLGVSRCSACVQAANVKLDSLEWSQQNRVGQFR